MTSPLAFEPAFPVSGNLIHAIGLTKREYFAGLVLSGYASDPSTTTTSIPLLAEFAVKWADALIAALEKPHD